MSVQFDGNRIGPGVGHISRLLSFIGRVQWRFESSRGGFYLQVEGLGEAPVKAGGADQKEGLGLVLKVTLLYWVGATWGENQSVFAP